jgi:hypothetical protein
MVLAADWEPLQRLRYIYALHYGVVDVEVVILLAANDCISDQTVNFTIDRGIIAPIWVSNR